MCDPERRYDGQQNEPDCVIAVERSLWRLSVSRHQVLRVRPWGGSIDAHPSQSKFVVTFAID
jgi:hypothetical protein